MFKQKIIYSVFIGLLIASQVPLSAHTGQAPSASKKQGNASWKAKVFFTTTLTTGIVGILVIANRWGIPYYEKIRAQQWAKDCIIGELGLNDTSVQELYRQQKAPLKDLTQETKDDLYPKLSALGTLVIAKMLDDELRGRRFFPRLFRKRIVVPIAKKTSSALAPYALRALEEDITLDELLFL